MCLSAHYVWGIISLEFNLVKLSLFWEMGPDLWYQTMNKWIKYAATSKLWEICEDLVV